MSEREVDVEKEWIHDGLKCIVLFIKDSHRCGYVGVKKGNPAYELNYDDIPVSVHGGLTYGAHDVNKKKTPDIYWLGFDCAHAGDKTVWDISSGRHGEDHFWTKEEVIKETEELAEQLAKLTWELIVKQKLEYMPDWFKERVSIKLAASPRRKRGGFSGSPLPVSDGVGANAPENLHVNEQASR